MNHGFNHQHVDVSGKISQPTLGNWKEPVFCGHITYFSKMESQVLRISYYFNLILLRFGRVSRQKLDNLSKLDSHFVLRPDVLKTNQKFMLRCCNTNHLVGFYAWPSWSSRFDLCTSSWLTKVKFSQEMTPELTKNKTCKTHKR